MRAEKKDIVCPNLTKDWSPSVLQKLSQPLLRHLLLHLANYHPVIDGTFPPAPFLALLYPHGEHLNSFFIPPKENVHYVAAVDTFFKNLFIRSLLPYLLNATPISRGEDSSHSKFKAELAQMIQLIQANQNLAIYPQGTRAGLAPSLPDLVEQIKPGIALIAQTLAKHGAVIVPVGLFYPDGYNPHKGGDSAWQEFKKHWPTGPPRREVVVRIGDPLPNQFDRKEFPDSLARILWEITR